MKGIIRCSFIWTMMLALVCTAFLPSCTHAEYSAWICPKCGRNGNTGSYCESCGIAAPWKKPEVGDCVSFGTYPQTAEGTDKTPIEWLVLAMEENRALLLSRYGLDVKPYNIAWTDVTWETCSLRNWLNNEFLNKAFSAEEQSSILTTDVDNSSDQGYSGWNTPGGNNTQDKVFLLSYEEANKYLSVTYDYRYNTIPRMVPTAYAIQAGAYTSNFYKTAEGNTAGWWWLRSPGSSQSNASYVNVFGSLKLYNVSIGIGCVRPAFWLNLETGIY